MRPAAAIALMLTVMGVAPPSAASGSTGELPWLVCGERPCTETAHWRAWPAGRAGVTGKGAVTLHLAGGYCLDLGEGPIERMRFVSGLVVVWRGGSRTLFLQEISLGEEGWPALPIGEAGSRMLAARRDGVIALWHVTPPPVPQWTAYIVPERYRERRYVIQLALSGFPEREAEGLLGSLRACRW